MPMTASYHTAPSLHQAPEHSLIHTKVVTKEAEYSTQVEMSPLPAFRLLDLPTELLHQIASEYYASLPPTVITPTNLHFPHHALTPLSLSSPLFSILPASLYYSHTTFLFSSPFTLRDFARLHNRSETVRKVTIWYGPIGPLGPGCGGDDWVHSLLSSFEGLEEIVFVVDGEMDRRAMEIWWECVCDAVREGVAAQMDSGRRSRRGLVLRVECGGEGFEGWCERIGGSGEKEKYWLL